MGTSGLRDVPSFSRSATCVVQSACIVITQGAFLSSFHRDGARGGVLMEDRMFENDFDDSGTTGRAAHLREPSRR